MRNMSMPFCLAAILAAAMLMTACEDGGGGGGNGVACGPYTVSVDQSARNINISGVGSLDYSAMAQFRPPTADARVGETNIRLTNMVWDGDQLASFDITIDGTHSCRWP